MRIAGFVDHLVPGFDIEAGCAEIDKGAHAADRRARRHGGDDAFGGRRINQALAISVEEGFLLLGREAAIHDETPGADDGDAWIALK